jgi:hypothetical protein
MIFNPKFKIGPLSINAILEHFKLNLEQMIRKIQFFILLLTALVTFSYSKYPSDNFPQYYDYINQAENKIVDGDNSQALELYEKAFALVHSPLGIDYHNALKVALMTEDTISALSYCKKLILKGCELSYFNDDNFPKMSSKVQLIAKVKESYPALHNVFESAIDTQLRAEVRNRYVRDQSVDDSNRPSYFYDNIMWLKTKMLENKFPNEDLIGIRLENNEMSAPYIHLFLIHWFDNHNGDPLNLLLIPLLKKQIQLGNLSPDFFASLKNVNPEMTYSINENVAYVILGDSVLSPKLDEHRLKIINTNRQNLNLCNFSDYQKKVRCRMINKVDKGSSVDEFVFDSEEERKNVINMFIEKGYEVIGDIKTVFNIK